MLASYVIARCWRSSAAATPKILIEIEVESLKEAPIEDFDITLLGADEHFDADIVARKVIESESHPGGVTGLSAAARHARAAAGPDPA